MNPNGLPPDVHAALTRLEQAKQQREQEQITRARQKGFLPSCSVNIDPDSIRFNFDKDSNPKLALEVLREQLEQIKRQSTGSLPQTDRVLRTLAKKKSLVQTMITQLLTSESLPPTFGATPRRDKRIEKKLRRKALRFEQARK
jgi:hypothetical protein